jgi:hypothetical protein
MNDAKSICEKIETLFRAHEWRGAIPIEQAIADSIAYHAQLNESDRAYYEEQIALGVHPFVAQETTELMSGRQQPRTARRSIISIGA